MLNWENVCQVYLANDDSDECHTKEVKDRRHAEKIDKEHYQGAVTRCHFVRTNEIRYN